MVIVTAIVTVIVNVIVLCTLSRLVQHSCACIMSHVSHYVYGHPRTP